MMLQLATAFLALQLMRKTREKTLWLFFCLAALGMLGWRIARWWEVVQGGNVQSATHLWLDTLFGFWVTIFFFVALVVARTMFTRMSWEQEQLAQARELTWRERDKLQQLLERLPVGVAVEQEQGIVYANSAFLSMLDLDENSLKQGRVVDLVAPEHRGVLMEKAHKSSNGARVMELELVRRDGSRLWASSRCHQVVWAEKPATLWVFSGISECKAAEAQREAIFQLFS